MSGKSGRQSIGLMSRICRLGSTRASPGYTGNAQPSRGTERCERLQFVWLELPKYPEIHSFSIGFHEPVKLWAFQQYTHSDNGVPRAALFGGRRSIRGLSSPLHVHSPRPAPLQDLPSPLPDEFRQPQFASAPHTSSPACRSLVRCDIALNILKSPRPRARTAYPAPIMPCVHIITKLI